jgi:hypothetical protein
MPEIEIEQQVAEKVIRDFLRYMKEEAPSKFELTLLSIGLPMNTEYDTLGECIDRWWNTVPPSK